MIIYIITMDILLEKLMRMVDSFSCLAGLIRCYAIRPGEIRSVLSTISKFPESKKPCSENAGRTGDGHCTGRFIIYRHAKFESSHTVGLWLPDDIPLYRDITFP
jgi:hypothetical protein